MIGRSCQRKKTKQKALKSIGVKEQIIFRQTLPPQNKSNIISIKTQNIKQLCIEYGIKNSLDAKPLEQYSRQNYDAFLKVKREYEQRRL